MNAPKRWLPKRQVTPAPRRAAAETPNWRRAAPAPAQVKPRRSRFYDHPTSQKGS